MTKPTGRPRGRPPGKKNRETTLPKKTAQDAPGSRLRRRGAEVAGDTPKLTTGQPTPPSVAVGGNVSDRTIADWYGQALGAKIELEKAQSKVAKAREEQATKNGIYRNILKSAEKSGIPAEAIRWRLEQRSKDIADIDRFHGWCNRIAKITSLPLGTQLGLFDDGQTVASKVDEAAIAAKAKPAIPTVSELVAAADAGADAAREGQERKPPHEEGSPLALRWLQGYDDQTGKLLVEDTGLADAPEMARA